MLIAKYITKENYITLPLVWYFPLCNLVYELLLSTDALAYPTVSTAALQERSSL